MDSLEISLIDVTRVEIYRHTNTLVGNSSLLLIEYWVSLNQRQWQEISVPEMSQFGALIKLGGKELKSLCCLCHVSLRTNESFYGAQLLLQNCVFTTSIPSIYLHLNLHNFVLELCMLGVELIRQNGNTGVSGLNRSSYCKMCVV